jgi:ribonuclease VapC
MLVDASAIVAVLVAESDAPTLEARLDQAGHIFTSPVAIYEAILGIARVLNVSVAVAQAEVDNFIAETGAQVISINGEIGRGAIRAFERYGRGRHPARLNMGDCFAYACARSLDVPLLFKGDDFPQTDIAWCEPHPLTNPAALRPAMRPKTAPAISPVPLA